MVRCDTPECHSASCRDHTSPSGLTSLPVCETQNQIQGWIYHLLRKTLHNQAPAYIQKVLIARCTGTTVRSPDHRLVAVHLSELKTKGWSSAGCCSCQIEGQPTGSRPVGCELSFKWHLRTISVLFGRCVCVKSIFQPKSEVLSARWCIHELPQRSSVFLGDVFALFLREHQHLSVSTL